MKEVSQTVHSNTAISLMVEQNKTKINNAKGKKKTSQHFDLLPQFPTIRTKYKTPFPLCQRIGKSQKKTTE